jgi:hypothetical protein
MTSSSTCTFGSDQIIIREDFTIYEGVSTEDFNKDKEVSTEDFNKDKEVSTEDFNKDKEVSTEDFNKDKEVSTENFNKDKEVSTENFNIDKEVSTEDFTTDEEDCSSDASVSTVGYEDLYDDSSNSANTARHRSTHITQISHPLFGYNSLQPTAKYTIIDDDTRIVTRMFYLWLWFMTCVVLTCMMKAVFA